VLRASCVLRVCFVCASCVFRVCFVCVSEICCRCHFHFFVRLWKLCLQQNQNFEVGGWPGSYRGFLPRPRHTLDFEFKQMVGQICLKRGEVPCREWEAKNSEIDEGTQQCDSSSWWLVTLSCHVVSGWSCSKERLVLQSQWRVFRSKLFVLRGSLRVSSGRDGWRVCMITRLGKHNDSNTRKSVNAIRSPPLRLVELVLSGHSLH
jgi:hypothetical protein